MWVALEVVNKVFDIGFYLVNKDSSPHESVHLPKVVDCFLMTYFDIALSSLDEKGKSTFHSGQLSQHYPCLNF
jgi:hypothetical protein